MRRQLGALFLFCVIDTLGFGILIPLVPYMADRFGTPPQLITPLLGSYSLCQLLAAPWWGRLSDRYGSSPEPAVRAQVARALVNKGFMLGELGRPEQQLTIYAQIEDRFGDAPQPALREELARALVSKGHVAETLGRCEEAIATYDRVEDRFGGAPEPGVREMVATALVNKGLVLGELGRWDDAVAVYDQADHRFGDAPESGIQKQVARATHARDLLRNPGDQAG